MNQSLKSTLTSASLLAALLCVTLLGGVQAEQKRRQQTQRPTGSYLPRASFPSYGSDGGRPQQQSGSSPPPAGADLPSYNGLNLEGSVGHGRGKVEPYDPGEPSLRGALVRWDQRRFPLRIWISEGKKLPDVPWVAIVQDRVPRVLALLQNDPRSLDALPQAPGWVPQMNDWAAAGFDMWKDMEREGVVSYGYVFDPSQADVLIFFTDRFAGAEGPGGTSVNGQTYGQVFTAQQIADKTRLGQRTVPVIMELKVPFVSQAAPRLPDGREMEAAPNMDETAQVNFIANAAHEFGHALGIKAHSPYMDDLMYVNRNLARQPSASDKATLRLLYKKFPQYWYF